jgi:hypothetical protein
MKFLNLRTLRGGIFLFLMLSLAGQISANEVGADPEKEDRPPIPEVELPFLVGEKLTYVVYWGWIGVGTSEATTQWVWRDAAWALQIRFRTQSHGVLNRIYPVDDVVEVYIDSDSLNPTYFVLDLKEGKHARDANTVFGWEKMEAVYTKKHEDKDDEVKVVELEEGTRDLVSFMYFMRRHEFKDKETYEFKVLSDYKIYDLTVETDGHDNVRLENYGRVRSLKMNPKAQFEGVFVRKGEMEVWLSTDDRQLLTKLELDTPFANVRLLLRSVEGPGEDDWVKE